MISASIVIIVRHGLEVVVMGRVERTVITTRWRGMRI